MKPIILINKTVVSQSVKICEACGQPIEIGDWYCRQKTKYADGSIRRASRHYECAVAVYTYCHSGEMVEGVDSNCYSDIHFLRWCEKEGFNGFEHISNAIESLNKCRMTE